MGPINNGRLNGLKPVTGLGFVILNKNNSLTQAFEKGKLRVSTGDLLPYNTVSGEEGSLRDLLSPHMDNENPLIDKLFVIL